MKRRGKLNVAIYLRVSKADGSQDEMNQAPDCLQLCEARGWPDPVMFRERASGADADRPEWRHLMDLARRGICHVIVIWAIDRAGRRFYQTLEDIGRLKKYGCRVVSVRESYLDTDDVPGSRSMVALAADVAEQERARQIERINAGIARRRAKGLPFGRPRVWVDPVELLQLRARGLTVRDLARRFQVSQRTIVYRLASAQKGGGDFCVPPPAADATGDHPR
jgi:DNA invertase Pin-like site-specific DNA recombinase